MKRKPRLATGNIYHIFNRGVSKRKIFMSDSDYKFFMLKISTFKEKYFINVISFCLMPNHFHLLLYTEHNPKNIAKFMKSLQISYAIYFNFKYKHTGHVFQGKYVNKEIISNEMPNLINYIEQNPVKERLVKFPEEWLYRG